MIVKGIEVIPHRIASREWELFWDNRIPSSRKETINECYRTPELYL